MARSKINYITTEEAAVILCKSPLTLVYWRSQLPRDKQPPFYKIGHHVRYIEDELHDWIQVTNAQRCA